MKPVVERLQKLGYLQDLDAVEDDFMTLIIDHAFLLMNAVRVAFGRSSLTCCPSA